MRVVTITTASSSGVAPPASPVPLPRATNGRPCRRAMRTAAATSSADRGQHTATAWPSLTPGVAAVERELERLRARTGRTERIAQISEERVVRCDRREINGARLGRSPFAVARSVTLRTS